VLLTERFARRRVLVLLAAGSLTIQAVPVAARPGAGEAGTISAFAKIRIDNFGRINDAYYRGAQPTGRDFSDLAAFGIKTLIDLTGDDGEANEAARAEAAGLSYVHLPMTTHVAPSPETLAQFLAIVNDPARQPVYVHCVGGRHRTGVMTAAFRMTHDGWSGDQAFKEMKRYKFGADYLHPEFKAFVYRYRPERTVESRDGASAPAATIGK
jgi:protein tyrosine phosphatase (PTP) superfamily phosphohydrolase (DUF442 family)